MSIPFPLHRKSQAKSRNKLRNAPVTGMAFRLPKLLNWLQSPNVSEPSSLFVQVLWFLRFIAAEVMLETGRYIVHLITLFLASRFTEMFALDESSTSRCSVFI